MPNEKEKSSITLSERIGETEKLAFQVETLAADVETRFFGQRPSTLSEGGTKAPPQDDYFTKHERLAKRTQEALVFIQDVLLRF